MEVWEKKGASWCKNNISIIDRNKNNILQFCLANILFYIINQKISQPNILLTLSLEEEGDFFNAIHHHFPNISSEGITLRTVKAKVIVDYLNIAISPIENKKLTPVFLDIIGNQKRHLSINILK